MPNLDQSEPVEWSEANLSKVISDIYSQAASDPAFYDRLMAQPYEVLNSKINVPDHYKGQVYARPKKSGAFIMNVPTPPAAEDAATASARTSEIPPADYQILCTSWPPW